MSVNVDELGPVDWIVVEFRGSKFTGDIAPILKDYVDRGLIRILDLLFMRKDDDWEPGSVRDSRSRRQRDRGVA